ncbi:MAG: hypothetical protein OXK79_01905 [Chloroflexota bacterium]|nr:hypothetical protein [Chloroflexota bacterium]
MPTVDLIIAVASWEPRFLMGMRSILERYRTQRMLVYFLNEYRNVTSEPRRELNHLAEAQRIDIETREIQFSSPSSTWRALEADLASNRRPAERVLLDLTTMPREVIWSTLFWLESRNDQVRYVYHRPLEYGSDWLARDPSEPRLAYKLAGQLEPGRPTALVLVTGFDADRCRQAVDFFEPSRLVLATQIGEQFDNAGRNVGPRFQQTSGAVEHVDVDAYAPDHGFAALHSSVRALSQEHNVVLCSFGPKPSALALYRLQRSHRHAALAFIGCREYNTAYSNGLGETLEGSFHWSGDPPSTIKKC